MLVSNLIVWYFFLGGLGAGGCIVALTIGLLSRLRPSCAITQLWPLRSTMFTLSLGSIVAGMLCLMKDLGNPENTTALIVSPSFSIISLGALSLGGLAVCLAVLAISEYGNKHPDSRRTVLSIEIAAAILAFAVAAYPGIYLNQLTAIPLWGSPCIPILFFLSALSTGCGMLFLVIAARPHLTPCPKFSIVSFFIADSLIIILEVVTAAIFLVCASQDPFTNSSVEMLVMGQCATRFLFGFVGCGLLIPLVLEIIISFCHRNPRMAICFLGCCILIGGYFLRSCIMETGIHVSTLMFASI